MTETAGSHIGYGIPRVLAESRAASVGELRYALMLSIPREPGEPLDGEVAITFNQNACAWPLVDFAPAGDDAACAAAILSLRLNGSAAPFALEQGHIRLLAPAAPGPQRLDIRFRAGPVGLTRRRDLVYSLLVPARAHRVFPCFDQPDLKARFSLELDLPGDWDGTANGALTATEDRAGRRRLRFAETEPLPCYLFAFAAGRLRRETAELDSRRFTILMTETATAAFAEHRDELLRLHVAALDALEDYTAIPQPFAHLGFVLIPDFEFAGMEHPGAVVYRQSLLLLSADASVDDRVRRAHLIAHETAHLWFGDLVTMRWFDDVWLKEVCANFMADKIVAREFPEIDHTAAFLLRHFPPAYAIDRTAGTHAIREPLANLAEAAERYDALIYHKAPIAFAALEHEMGADALRDGFRRYLRDFQFGAADWDDLRERLQKETRTDLRVFSREWIERAGLPEQRAPFDPNSFPGYGVTRLTESDRRRALSALGTPPAASAGASPSAGAGRSAGACAGEGAVAVEVAGASVRTRAAAWITLVEDMLAGGLDAPRLLSAAVELLRTERDVALLGQVLEDLAGIYWRILDEQQRSFAAGPVERVLRLRLAEGDRTFWLRAFARLALTAESLAWLESVWHGGSPGLADLSETLREKLALTLALHWPERAAAILDRQMATTRDDSRRRQLEFLSPALSGERPARDALFARLLAGTDRSTWIVAAIGLLNHPLRAAGARHYLRPAIEYAARIHARGDIFLPRQWLTALLHGHGSAEAAAIVTECLHETGMSTGFRRLLLQVSDPLFRALRIRSDRLRSGT